MGKMTTLLYLSGSMYNEKGRALTFISFYIIYVGPYTSLKHYMPIWGFADTPVAVEVNNG